MRLKNKLPLLLLLLSLKALALVELPSGKVSVEGKIWWQNEEVYLLINHETYSQIKILLKGDVKELKGQHFSNVELTLELEKKATSSGEARLVSVNKFLRPGTVPKEYTETKDFN